MADTQLREALEKIRRTPVMPFPDRGAHSERAFADAVWRAWSQIQQIADAALSAPPVQEPKIADAELRGLQIARDIVCALRMTQCIGPLYSAGWNDAIDELLKRMEVMPTVPAKHQAGIPVTPPGVESGSGHEDDYYRKLYKQGLEDFKTLRAEYEQYRQNHPAGSGHECAARRALEPFARVGNSLAAKQIREEHSIMTLDDGTRITWGDCRRAALAQPCPSPMTREDTRLLAGYSSDVVLTVNAWIDAGSKGPIPWPDNPFFAQWAEKNGFSNVDGFVGFSFVAQLTNRPDVTRTNSVAPADVEPQDSGGAVQS